MKEQFVPYEQSVHFQKDEFILPKKWYVVSNSENINVLRKWRGSSSVEIGDIVGMCEDTLRGRVVYMRSHNPCHITKGEEYDFGKEITFEQFKKYVLGSDHNIDKTNNMKKLIGYKIKPEFKEAYNIISAHDVQNENITINIKSIAVDEFRKLKVLDLWFDPVYEDELPIKFGVHTAKFNENAVTFGCTSFSEDEVRVLYNFLSHDSYKSELTVDNQTVTIEFLEKILKKFNF